MNLLSESTSIEMLIEASMYGMYVYRFLLSEVLSEI